MIKRNHSYSVGDIEYTANDYILKCKTAGITALDPLVINSGGGGAITDGTVEWEVIKDGDMPSGVYEAFAWTPTSNYGSAVVGTAPADGYLWVYGVGEGSGNKYLSIANGRYTIIELGSSGRADVSVMAWISSGESMTVSSSVIKANETHYCRFYYSVNSAKELGLI